VWAISCSLSVNQQSLSCKSHAAMLQSMIGPVICGGRNGTANQARTINKKGFLFSIFFRVSVGYSYNAPLL
jgi:hypothetical protein